MAATTIRPSLTSNSANTTASTVDTILASARPRDLNALVENLDPMGVWLQKTLKTRTIKSVKPEWTDRRYPPVAVTADAAGYASGATTVNVVTGTGVRLQVWDVLRNPVTGEQFQVTAIATDALTVVRGVGGTAAAAIAVSQAFDILAPAAPENVASPASPMTFGEFYFNYIQNFDYGFQFSKIENAVDQSYLISGNPYDDKVKSIMRFEGPRDLERVLLMGARQAASGTGGAGIPYMMGGLNQFITTVVATKAGAALTEADFLTNAQTVWSDVGPDNMFNTLIVGIFARQVISSWVDSMRQMTAMDTKVTLKLDTIENDLGTFQFMPHYHMPADTLFGVKLSNYTLLTLEGNDWYDEPLMKDGPYLRGHVNAVKSLQATGDRSSIKVSGFSTTRGDYASLQVSP